MMVSSKYAYAAVHVPAAWPRVEFNALLGESAVNFMEFATECRELTVVHDSPRQILRFLEAVAGLAVAQSVAVVTVRLVAIDFEDGPRVSSKIFVALAKFPNLETLTVNLGNAIANFRLHGVSMPRLRTLRVVERSNPSDDMFYIAREELQSTVRFAGSTLPALETLELSVASSDAVEVIPDNTMPALRRLVYRSRNDTYREVPADMGRRHLDSLTLATHADPGGDACLQLMLKYGVISARHVTLLVSNTVSNTIELEELPGVEELTLVLALGAEVIVSWHVLKRLRAVNISGDGHGIFRVCDCLVVEFAEFWKNNVHTELHRDCVLVTDSRGFL